MKSWNIEEEWIEATETRMENPGTPCLNLALKCAITELDPFMDLNVDQNVKACGVLMQLLRTPLTS
jgi:hypothetical protein